MRSAGEITYADAHKQRVGEGWELQVNTFQSFICVGCVYSIVEYATHEDMKNAMKKLNGSELNGRKIKLIDDYRGKKRR